jgi:hypothetical protein
LRTTKKRKSQENKQDIPSQVHQRTWLALENRTDYAAFQQLCDEVLTAHWGYKIHPRGMSARGTVKGHPDSWGHDNNDIVGSMIHHFMYSVMLSRR